jgi:hypothetical protein
MITRRTYFRPTIAKAAVTLQAITAQPKGSVLPDG